MKLIKEIENFSIMIFYYYTCAYNSNMNLSYTSLHSLLNANDKYNKVSIVINGF